MIYRNLRTGKRYRWLAAGIDCTNARDGLPVVVYCPDDDEHTVFVRDQAEFADKFQEEPPSHSSLLSPHS
jgi:hypothetical protein